MIRLYKIIGYIRDFNYRRGAHFAWAVFAELYKNDQFKNAWKDIGAKEHINGLEIIRKKLQNVEFYVEDRKCDLDKFIYDINDSILQAELFFELARINESEVDARSPYESHVRDGIYKLELNRKGIVLYFYFWGSITVVTNGFIDAKGKGDIKQLELAKERRDKHLNRIYGEYDEW